MTRGITFRSRVFVVLAAAVSLMFVACGSSEITGEQQVTGEQLDAALAEASLFKTLARPLEGAMFVFPFEGVDEVMPNAEAVTVDYGESEFKIDSFSDYFVVGRVVDVEEGVSLVWEAEGESSSNEPPGLTELDYGDSRAQSSRVYVTVAVLEQTRGPGKSTRETVTFALSLPEAMDVKQVRRELKSMGKITLFLKEDFGSAIPSEEGSDLLYPPLGGLMIGVERPNGEFILPALDHTDKINESFVAPGTKVRDLVRADANRANANKAK